MDSNQIKETLKQFEKKSHKQIYYLYGEETYKIDEFLNQAISTLFGGKKSSDSDLDFCLDKLDGTQVKGVDVLDAVSSIGLFGPSSNRRVVIVRSAHSLKETEPLLEALQERPIEQLFGDNVLFFIGDSLDSRKKFHQWLKKEGVAFEFKLAKETEAVAWAKYMAKKLGAKLSDDAIELLVLLSEGSLFKLASEIEKCFLFEGGVSGVLITSNTVSQVSSKNVGHEVIELVRSILEGKRTRALLLSEKLITSSDQAIGLVGFLTWGIKNPQKSIGKNSIPGGPKRFMKIVNELRTLDMKLKSSGVEPALLVDRFLMSI